MNTPDKSNLKTLVRGAYDIQKLRISTGNRIVGNFKAKLGQMPSQSEETLSDEARDLLALLRTKNKKLTDGVTKELDQIEIKPDKDEEKLAKKIMKVVKESYKAHTEGAESFPTPKKFQGDAVISDYTELCLLEQYTKLEDDEASHFSRLKYVLEDCPVYTEFLKGVKGIGPAMAGVIISEIDISKATYASSLHMFAGLDVAQDGAGRSKRAEHLVTRPYIDKKGEEAEKQSITFNPFLKTKLIGVLGPCILRAGEGPYSKVYYDYKHRLENHPAHKDKTKGHIHAMSIRYAVKRLLVDLYVNWRRLEGLPVEPEYSEAKLGMVHRKVA